jgi:RNA polymerase sigma-70 factor (ECF subfamily)
MHEDIAKELLVIQPKLYAQAMRFLNNDKQAAEDLVQDCLLKVLTNQDKFESGTNLNAWSFIILRNLFINAYRTNRKFNCNADVEHTEYYLTEISPDFADNDIRYDQLYAYLQLLADKPRLCFELHLEGYKYDEIAEKMSIPIGTVKSCIFHARLVLQKAILSEQKPVSRIHECDINASEDNNEYYQTIKPIERMTDTSPVDKLAANWNVNKCLNLIAFFKDVYAMSNNEWISSRDYPLSSIISKHNLVSNWGTPIRLTMQNSKFFDVTGERAGMQYRSYVITEPESLKEEPNYELLAANAIAYYNDAITHVDIICQHIHAYIQNGGAPAIAEKRIYHKQSSKPNKSNTDYSNIVKNSKHFAIDDYAYMFVKSDTYEIQQVLIVGCSKKTGDYLYDIKTIGGAILETCNESNLYHSPRELAELLIKNTKTF